MFQKIVFIILILVLVGAIGFFIVSRNQPGSDDGHKTSPQQEPQDGAVAPANGLIALQLKDRNGSMQVFTVKSDGTGLKQLTFEGENGRPAWSPDGRKILFSSFHGGTFPGATASVWLMDADGSNKKMIAEGHTADGWSPDGLKIVYAQKGQIWAMDADGKNEKRITASKTFKAGPTWSHDGNQIAFILLINSPSQANPRPEIGIMNADGTNERILTLEDRTNVKINPDGSTTVLETAYDANAPSWSPVEGRIAFWSGIENQYGQVWVINADGTDGKQLTEDPNHKNSDDPSWSPDGKKILFSTGRSGGNELWVMDASGENEKRISDIDAFPFPGRASWQPVYDSEKNDGDIINKGSYKQSPEEGILENLEDGPEGGLNLTAPTGVEEKYDNSTIIFVRGLKELGDTTSEIYSINPDGTDLRRLTNNNFVDDDPELSPDKKKIVFKSSRDGGEDIYIMDIDGSNVKRITSHPTPDSMPDWSRDGKKIVFQSMRDGNPEIYTMEADGSNIKRLTFNEGESGINTPFEEKTGIDPESVDAQPKWSPIEDKIVFFSSRDGNQELYTMDSDGTNVKRLTNHTEPDGDPAWSPDGKKIVFGTNRDGHVEVYAMNADGSNQINISNYKIAENGALSQDGDMAYSPDGNKIVFVSTRNGAEWLDELYIMNADGSSPKRLTTHSGRDYNPDW